MSPSDIVVFYTPPRKDTDKQRLENLGVDLRLVELTTEAFTAFDYDDPHHYGEKTWVETIEDDEVLFLDCDTRVFRDPELIFEGDFDIKVRTGKSQVIQPDWEEMFERFGEEYVDWVPNAGLIAFKNGTHREIGPVWRKYVNSDLGYRHYNNTKEQYALALSAGGHDIKKMSTKEHVMLWKNEYPADGIVYHLGKELEPWQPANFFDHMYEGVKDLLDGKIR